MFDVPTVLILGAGASMPYGFPSGRRLLFDIRDTLATGVQHMNSGGDPDRAPIVYRAVRWFKFNDLKIKFFVDALNETMHPSIDAFLERYSEFMDIGKVSLAASLIPYEQRNMLMQRDRDEVQWYEYFFNLVRDPDEFMKRNLSVVTFNYDRSFEYFLYYAFMNSFHLDSAQAIELMKNIPIVHIYGNLGAPKFLSKDGRDYKNDVTVEDIQKCIDGLKIISEVEDTHPTFPQVHTLVAEAQKVIFIGFSFLPANVQRLKLRLHLTEVVGTVYYMKQGEITRVQSTLLKYLTRTPSLYDLDALNFLRETDFF